MCRFFFTCVAFFSHVAFFSRRFFCVSELCRVSRLPVDSLPRLAEEDVNLSGAALALDVLEEIEALRI